MSPPPPGAAGALSFSGFSAITASVVRNRPAMDAAFCSADLVTLAGSMIPAAKRSTYSPVAASRPCPTGSVFTFSTTTPPSRPAFTAICLSGSSTARRTMVAPVASSPDSSSFLNALAAAWSRATPLPTGCLSVAPRVLEAVLALLHPARGSRPRLDDGDAAGQLGQPLLQLLPVIVRVGVVDLGADLVDPAGDLLGVASAVDDRRLVLGDHDLAGPAEHVEVDVLQLQADFLADDLATGQDGDVTEHGLAAVAEARGLDGHRLEQAAHLVHDQGRQGLALDVLGEDDQRLAGLHHLVEQREQVLVRRDLGVDHEDV